MCSASKTSRVILFIFNFIFLLVAAAILAVGILYQVQYTDIISAIPKDYNLKVIPILTIVVGAIVFIISFLGCCGAIRKSPCLLTTYAIILLIIFLLQIAIGIFAIIEIKNKDDFQNKVNDSILNLFNKKDKDSKDLIDVIQETFKCCGATGPDFWHGNEKPDSCYSDKKNGKFYEDGCDKEFYEFLNQSAQVIGIILLSLAVTAVVGATISLCLVNAIRNNRRNNYV